MLEVVVQGPGAVLAVGEELADLPGVLRHHGQLHGPPEGAPLQGVGGGALGGDALVHREGRGRGH